MANSSEKGNGVLVLIASFKLVKAAFLIAIGFGALKLLHGEIPHVVTHWTLVLTGDAGSHFLREALAKLTNLSPRKLELVAAAMFLYAALFLVEGIGLLLRKRWAEYFTLIMTSSFVPLELYEIFHKPSALKVLALVINVAVLVYLGFYLRKHRAHGHFSQTAAG